MGQGARFVVIGGLGTALYVGLFWVFALMMGTQSANISSWVLATVLGNLLHRRYTYGVRGGHLRRTDNVVTFATALVELAASAALLEAFSGAGALSQGGLVVLGTVVGGALRFVLNRVWFARSAPNMNVAAAVDASS